MSNQKAIIRRRIPAPIAVATPDPTKWPAAVHERLAFVAHHDPTWAVDIATFLAAHPEFVHVGHVASATRYPRGYGKNPLEIRSGDMPYTINEHLLYYVAHAGVRTDYGMKLWLAVREVALGKTPGRRFEDIDIADPRKQATLATILTLPPLQSWRDVDTLDIAGVGAGAKGHIRYLWDPSFKSWVNTTDLHFKRGLAVVLGLPAKKLLTDKEVRELTAGWGELGAVGSMLSEQAWHWGRDTNT